jgi:hypothetical protein
VDLKAGLAVISKMFIKYIKLVDLMQILLYFLQIPEFTGSLGFAVVEGGGCGVCGVLRTPQTPHPPIPRRKFPENHYYFRPPHSAGAPIPITPIDIIKKSAAASQGNHHAHFKAAHPGAWPGLHFLYVNRLRGRTRPTHCGTISNHSGDSQRAYHSPLPNRSGEDQHA